MTRVKGVFGNRKVLIRCDVVKVMNNVEVDLWTAVW